MIQVYTGNGKGKTTAALGLALRAAGAGMEVYIAQFAKGRPTSELIPLKKIKNIRIERFGSGAFIKKAVGSERARALQGLNAALKALHSKKYDMVILDEVNVVVDLGLLSPRELGKLLCCAPAQKEVVLTGRNAPPEVLERADLISHIEEVRHYFRKGVKARKGIEY